MKQTYPYSRFFQKKHLALLLAITLLGCVNTSDIPTYSAEHIDISLLIQDVDKKGDTALTTETMPTLWWELFNDPMLITLESEAAKSNFDLQTALLRVEESRAQLGLAFAPRLPQLDASSGYSRQAISKNEPLSMLGAPSTASSSWNLGLQASWELDLWGYLRHQNEAALAKLQVTNFGMIATRNSLSAEVARTYLLVRGIQSQEKIYKEHRNIAQRLLTIAEDRKKNGVATISDVALARAELAQIEAQLMQLQQQRDSSINALALLLGKPPHKLVILLVPKDLPSMPAQLPVGISSDLAKQRPDILQAEANLRAAVADIGAARADFYPRISLTGNIGLQAFELSDLGSWDSQRFSIGPSLYLPIFQGGRLQRNLELSEARHRIAGIAYQQTVLKAWHEVDDALSSYITEKNRHEQLQLAFEQNKAALNMMENNYKQGISDFTSVLIAQRSLLSSQSNLVDCATNSALSVVSLYRALGGGWSPELQINK